MQPVPAPRHSVKSSKTNLKLDIKDSASPQARKASKSKIPELSKSPQKSNKIFEPMETRTTNESPSSKSKIPIKLKTQENIEDLPQKQITETIKTAETETSLETKPSDNFQTKPTSRTKTLTTYSTQNFQTEDFERLENLLQPKFEIGSEITQVTRQVVMTGIQETSLGPEWEEMLKDGEVVTNKIVKTSMTTKSGSSEPDVWTETVTTKSLPDGKQETWKSVTSGSLQSEIWDTQCSLDTSPGSGNGDLYTKNETFRHELNSDTDSEGSFQPRRRSSSKRRTLGSSSGSDVALHEGAELSPLEDDQGISLTANVLSKQCTYPANMLSFVSQKCIHCQFYKKLNRNTTSCLI